MTNQPQPGEVWFDEDGAPVLIHYPPAYNEPRNDFMIDVAGPDGDAYSVRPAELSPAVVLPAPPEGAEHVVLPSGVVSAMRARGAEDATRAQDQWVANAWADDLVRLNPSAPAPSIKPGMWIGSKEDPKYVWAVLPNGDQIAFRWHISGWCASHYEAGPIAVIPDPHHPEVASLYEMLDIDPEAGL